MTPPPPADRPAAPGGSSLGDDPRFLWAAERTLLAWIRTGLALMGFGFLVARFGLFLRELTTLRGDAVPYRPTWSLAIGTGLVLLGVAVNFLAAWQQLRIERELFPGDRRVLPRAALALATALVLGLLGLALTGYLLTSVPRGAPRAASPRPVARDGQI